MNEAKRKRADADLDAAAPESSSLEPNADPNQIPAPLPFFLAVHCGAGYHAQHKDTAYRALMVRACRAGRECLTENPLCCAMDAVSAAIAVLEDSTLVNAGLGSNLTYSGKVQCDASIMDGTTGMNNAVPACIGTDPTCRWLRRRGSSARAAASDSGGATIAERGHHLRTTSVRLGPAVAAGWRRCHGMG